MKLSDTERRICEYSCMHNLGHVPSALSQATYLERILPATGYTRVAGKPFGAQAWHVICNDNPSNKLLLEPPLVYFNVQTVGHSLGYSIGLGTQDKVWLNLSDSSLLCGDFWEALHLWNIFRPDLSVTVDCNAFGCKTDVPPPDVLNDRISSYGVPCRIVKPQDASLTYGFTLVDTRDTIGAKLKHKGLHYTKFTLEELLACVESCIES